MKRKKLLSLILAGALSLSLCVPALADDQETPPAPEAAAGEGELILPADQWTFEEDFVPVPEEWAHEGETEPAPQEWFSGEETDPAPETWTAEEEIVPAPEAWTAEEEVTPPTPEETPAPEETPVPEAVPQEPTQPAEPWYAEAQRYVMEQGIMTGTGVDFDPYGTVTRVTAFHALWNMEGMPPERDVAPFSDVATTAWYQDSASWAQDAGITQGDGAGHYNPQWTISRAELACAFYRYAQFKGADMTVTDDTAFLNYSDALSVPDYASDALRWAVDRGILNGKVQDWLLCLDCGGSATRAELATMLMRLSRLLNGEVTETQSPS